MTTCTRGHDGICGKCGFCAYCQVADNNTLGICVGHYARMRATGAAAEAPAHMRKDTMMAAARNAGYMLTLGSAPTLSAMAQVLRNRQAARLQGYDVPERYSDGDDAAGRALAHDDELADARRVNAMVNGGAAAAGTRESPFVEWARGVVVADSGGELSFPDLWAVWAQERGIYGTDAGAVRSAGYNAAQRDFRAAFGLSGATRKGTGGKRYLQGARFAADGEAPTPCRACGILLDPGEGVNGYCAVAAPCQKRAWARGGYSDAD